MSLASYLLSKSSKLIVGSSIANIYARDSYTAQAGHGVAERAGTATASSSAWASATSRWSRACAAISYDKPISAMRAYLDGIHKDLPTGTEAPVMVAALGPKMLALSAREVDAAPSRTT